LWLVGRWLIGFARRLLGRALSRQNFDPTLARYLDNGVSVPIEQ
jgi:small conductance mechanosensitive channel